MANNIINSGEELENLRDKLEIKTGKGIIFRYDASFDKDSSYPVYWRKYGKHYLIYKTLTYTEKDMDDAYDRGIKDGKIIFKGRDLLGAEEGSLQNFIVHSEEYSRKDMSIVMSAVSNWIKKIKNG